jgi:hypothetical protein
MTRNSIDAPASAQRKVRTGELVNLSFSVLHSKGPRCTRARSQPMLAAIRCIPGAVSTLAAAMTSDLPHQRPTPSFAAPMNPARYHRSNERRPHQVIEPTSLHDLLVLAHMGLLRPDVGHHAVAGARGRNLPPMCRRATTPRPRGAARRQRGSLFHLNMVTRCGWSSPAITELTR